MNQADARTIWRDLVVEKFVSVVPDTTVDIYMDLGLQALNALAAYRTRIDSSLQTISGHQEYALPGDSNDLIWVEYGGSPATFLDKTSIQEFRRQGVEYRSDGAAAPPTKYYLYDRTIGLYPIPNAAVTLNLYFLADPPAFKDFGFADLPTGAYRLPIYYAAAVWSIAHPDSQQASSRASGLMTLFEKEGKVLADMIAKREFVR